MPAKNDCCGWGTSFTAKRWYSLDASGLMGVTLSWSVHIFALFVVSTKLISNSPVAMFIFVVLYLPASLLAMTSLYMTSTTDPGAVPLGARPLVTVRRASDGSQSTSRRAMRRCHKCQDNYKPPRAHHDSVTGRCVVKFDHFCPWANNAIGAMNHKFFCLFLFYTTCCCLLSLLLLLMRVIHCGFVSGSSDDDRLRAYGNDVNLVEDAKGESGERTLSTYSFQECERLYEGREILALLLASLIFMIFCIAMGCEQLEAIHSGKGKIARMKMSVGNQGTEFNKVTEEFNEMFGGTSPLTSWHWFWPAPVKFPRGMKKVVLGYEWDPSFPAAPYQEGDSEHSESSLPGGDGANNLTDPLKDTELTRMENGKSDSMEPLRENDGLMRSSSTVSIASSSRGRRRTPSRRDEGNIHVV